VQKEGERRGYKFDRGKILFPCTRCARIPVSDGQLRHEWLHLREKLMARDRKKARENPRAGTSAHPVFRKREGKKEEWEKD
jgi:hypothetical protein